MVGHPYICTLWKSGLVRSCFERHAELVHLNNSNLHQERRHRSYRFFVSIHFHKSGAEAHDIANLVKDPSLCSAPSLCLGKVPTLENLPSTEDLPKL